MILTMFLTLGLSSATLRYYFEYNEQNIRDKVISTALIASIIIAFAGALIANLFREQISLFWFDTSIYSGYFTLVLLAMAFEIAMEVPLSYIRAKELSVLFSSIVVSRLIIALSLNVLFVVYYRMGVKGILFSNIITSAIFGLWLMGHTLFKTAFAFSKDIFKKLMAYGWPLIFSGFGFFIISSSDRFFLKHYTSLDEIGLYSLASKFVSVLSLVIFSPFWKMYGPYRFSIMKRDDAKDVYANIQKGMLLLMVVCGLGLILMSKDILKILATPPFFGAYKPIPFLVLGAVSLAAYYLFQTGIYIEKQTKLISIMVATAAIINILLNFVLVPKMGMIGSAQAKFISYLALAVMTFFVSQRIYSIRYDFQSNIIILIGGVGLWLISNLILFDNIWLRLSINIILLLIYLGIMIKILFGKLIRIKILFQPFSSGA